MPLDKKLINRKITLINNDLKSLKTLSKLSLKTYLSKKVTKNVLKVNV